MKKILSVLLAAAMGFTVGVMDGGGLVKGVAPRGLRTICGNTVPWLR